jgi:hypothetical protein
VSAGFSGLQVLNHVDHEDGDTWRNFVTFDPAARYDGWSYEDVVLWPAAQALKGALALNPDARAWFMLSGEMGRSVWAFPERYLSLLGKYRDLLNGGAKRGGPAKVGVALHWNKVCGNCFDMPATNTYGAYNATYHRVFAEQKDSITSRFNTPALRELFGAVDVLGISHYAPSPSRGVSAGAFSLPIDTAAYELGHWGIDLKVRRVGGGDLGGGWAGGRVCVLTGGRAGWQAGGSACLSVGRLCPQPKPPAPFPHNRLAAPPPNPPPPPPPAPPPPQKLMHKGGKDFLFSEVGLGGGDGDNKRAATNLLELATNVHNGIWAVYNVAQDPWRNADYKEFRREWFK